MATAAVVARLSAPAVSGRAGMRNRKIVLLGIDWVAYEVS